MTAKLVLLFGLAVLCAYALSQRRRSPPLSLLMIVTSVVGALLVAFPELSTSAATAIGIGRGADLIFYIFILFSLIAIFNLHVHLREMRTATTELARSISIRSPLLPSDSTDDDGSDGSSDALPPSGGTLAGQGK